MFPWNREYSGGHGEGKRTFPGQESQRWDFLKGEYPPPPYPGMPSNFKIGWQEFRAVKNIRPERERLECEARSEAKKEVNTPLRRNNLARHWNSTITHQTEHGFDVVTGRQFAGSPVEEAKRTGRKAFPIQDPDTAQAKAARKARDNAIWEMRAERIAAEGLVATKHEGVFDILPLSRHGMPIKHQPTIVTAPSYSPPAQRQTRGPAEPPQPYYPKPAGCFGGQARTYSIPPQQQDHFWDMAASMQQSGSWGGEGGGGRTGNSSPSRAQQSQGADANGYYSPSGTQGGYGNSYDSTQGSGEGGYGGGGGGWSRGPSSPQHERAIMLPPQRQDYQLGSSGGRVGFQGCNL